MAAIRYLTIARARHGAAGVLLQSAAAAIAAGKTPGSLITVRRTSNGADGALQAGAEAAVPRSVPVHIAYQLQQAGHHYLDVRTETEFRAGHPERALNIPYLFRTDSGTAKNTQFLEQVSRILGKDDGIIVGCQSGRRSLMAATELHSAGFTSVIDMAGGFSSWRENGLPTKQQ
nr:unnamed protein product [Digitaria exilis]